MIGMPELLIIIVILGLVIFGGKKISEIARGAGKFSSEYKKGKLEAEKELNQYKRDLESEKSEDEKSKAEKSEEKIK